MDHKYTFTPNTRYITRGISEKIPVELQLFIWSKIDMIVKTGKTDYLQVFEFNVKNGYLEIEHRQEEPLYKMVYRLKLLETFKDLNKIVIFVIDDIDHSTMLLSSEY